jgi:hypothetical protein
MTAPILIEPCKLVSLKRELTPEQFEYLEKAIPAAQSIALLYRITPEGYLASEIEDLDKIRFTPTALCRLLLHFKKYGLNREDFLESCEILQGYIVNNKRGQKYKDHAAAIRSWVLDKILERKRRDADLERSQMYRDKAVGVMIGEKK